MRLLPTILALTTFSALHAQVPPEPSWSISFSSSDVAEAKLPFLSKSLTFALEIPPGPLAHRSPLLEIKGASDQPMIDFALGELGNQPALRLELYTNLKLQPLLLGIPLSLWKPKLPHNILFRYEGFRATLYLDGVLIDEEWPIGDIGVPGAKSLSLGKSITKLTVWNEALSDTSIQQLAGGPAEVAQREATFFGPLDHPMQYSRPRGYNTSAGDAMPFFHNGTLHVFFLLDRRHHSSKWGLGAHQWGHASTTDLVHWTHYPSALTIIHKWEGSICTGSVFFHDGLYSAFYATRTPDFCLILRSDGTLESGMQLHFQPQVHRVSWLPAPATSDASAPLATLNQIDGLEQSISVEIVAQGDVLDVCINGVRTMIYRSSKQTRKRLFAFAQNGNLELSNLKIQPILFNQSS